MYHCKGAVVASALLLSMSAEGSVVNEFVPDWRGTNNTIFAGFESFRSGFGGFNPADRDGSSCGCSLFSFGSGSALDADSDIRSGDAGLDIKLVGGQFSTQRLRAFVVNMATWDGCIETDQMSLTMFGPGGATSTVLPAELTELYQESFEDGSVYRSRAYRFEMADGFLSIGSVLQWRLEFTSSAGVTLDAISIDMDFNTVPSPGAIALGVLGLSIARFRRR